MSSPCRTKAALFNGSRPSLSTPQQLVATQQILSLACSTCIYCDIWKLVTLVASHVPLAARYDLVTGTPVSSPASSAPSSPTTGGSSSPIMLSSRAMSRRSISYSQLVSASKKIEAQFQAQRSRLNSILSICTVSGADQTEGLRMAYDRCSAAVEELLDREEDLEECLLRDLQEAQYSYHHNDYTYAGPIDYYSHDRSPNAINIAI